MTTESYLDKIRADLRSHLNDLYARRQMEFDAIFSWPLDSERDYENRGHAFGECRSHFERLIGEVENELVRISLATEENGIVYLHPLESSEQRRAILERL